MMYEREGYCPGNEFLHYGMRREKRKADFVYFLLQDRIGYMVYDPKMKAWGGTSSIVDLMFNDEQINVKVSDALRRKIPVCKYAEEGRKILIRDVISPILIPGVFHLKENEFSFQDEKGQLNVNYPVLSKNGGKKELLYSDKFVTVIEDEGEKVVMWIYKYPPA